MLEWLAAAGILIIVVLASVAAGLHWRLYRRRKAREQASELKRIERHTSINRSIQVIARALDAGQVGVTEASIRISVLLDALEVNADVKDEFSAFYKLAEEAAHIPILDAWKALPRERRKTFEEELVALEAKHGDFVADAAARIQGREF